MVSVVVKLKKCRNIKGRRKSSVWSRTLKLDDIKFLSFVTDHPLVWSSHSDPVSNWIIFCNATVLSMDTRVFCNLAA